MHHFYYRVGTEKASEESLTLPNGDFANKTACTEREYTLVSQLAMGWCFDIWTRDTRQVETLRPENCILRDGQVYAYYYETVPCIIYLADTGKAYTIRTEEETRIDSHDRKPYTETVYTKLRPCRLTKEGFAIWDKALFWCRKTAKGALAVPDGVEKITNYAFEDCSQITAITIPASTTYIYPKAFCNCSGLTSVTLPDKVYLSGDAFDGCPTIAQIQVDNAAGINWQVFRHTAFWKDPANRTNGGLYIGNCLVDVENTVSGEYTVLPGTEAVLDEAFQGCEKLTEVVLPDTLRAIGKGAFRNCRTLTQITLPHAVTKIACGVFSHCISLHTAMLSPDTKVIDDYAFCDCKNLTSIQLPDGLKELSYSAFSGCEKLQSISLPGSLRLIGATVFDPEWTENVFENCLSLETVTAQPGTYADKYVRRHRLGQYGYAEIPEGQQTIGAHAFAATALKTVKLPASLQTIKAYAFEACYRLETVEIPQGTEKIEVGAFRECHHLLSVTIPDSVVNIERFVFEWCDQVVIRCNSGSYAEEYAKREGLTIAYILD